MKKYSNLVYKQLKTQRKRTLLTILGIIIGVILFTTIGEITLFQKEVDIEASKTYPGDFEGAFYNMTYNQAKALMKNAAVKDYSFVALDSEEFIDIKDIDSKIKIYAIDKNSEEKTFSRTIELNQGVMPRNSQEIVLEEKAKDIFKKAIGDKLKVGSKEYKITGFFKRQYTNVQEIQGITFLDNLQAYNNIKGFVDLNLNKNRIEMLQEIGKDLGIKNLNHFETVNSYDSKIDYNVYLLEGYGENLGSYTDYTPKMVFVILCIIIMLTTVILTYSSINISAMERIKQFGLLRCIGATPRQIRNLIFKESLIIGACAIIPGILIGHGIVWVVVNIILKNLIQMELYGVKFHFYPMIVLMVLILTSITILLSAIGPALKAGKIAPIEGARQGNTKIINVDKIKKCKFIRKLFGYEGELAYRNLRANNKRFWVTVMTLTTSLIVFIVFTTYYGNILRKMSEQYTSMGKDGVIGISSVGKYVDRINENEEIKLDKKIVINELKKEFNNIENTKKELGKDNNIKDISVHLQMQKKLLFQGVEPYDNKVQDSSTGNFVTFNDNNDKFLLDFNSDVFVYDDEAFNEILPFIQGENVTLEKFKDNGIILINRLKVDNNMTQISEPFIKVKSGDTLKTYFLDFNEISDLFMNQNDIKAFRDIKNKNKVFNLNVLGNIDVRKLPEGSKIDHTSNFYAIVSKSFIEKNIEDFIGNELSCGPQIELYFNFKNEKARETMSESLEKYVTSNLGGYYIDYYEQMENERKSLLGTSIIIYGLLGLITLIVIINVINNRNISIALRKKEFGTMLSLGMERKTLKKTIILEGVIQWLISSVFGVIISFILIKAIYIGMVLNKQQYPKNAPIWIFIIAILGLLIINIISSIAPLRRFKKLDMTEMIRNEE